MDDKFDNDKFSQTRYPRREERQPLSFGSTQRRAPGREEPMQEARPADLDKYLRETRPQRTEHPSERAERPAERMEVSRREMPRKAAGIPSENGKRPQKTHKKPKRHLTGFAKGVIVLVAALLIGFFSFTFMNHLMNPPKEELKLTGEMVTVTIPEGAGTEDIAVLLKENKLIGSKFGFKLTSKLEGYDGTYKQGTYNIDTGMTKRQIMDLLQSGKVADDLKLTIPEGYTVKQIALKVSEMELCTADEFIEEANTGKFDYAFLKDLPAREYRLEGYLFPDTYFLTEGMTAHDIIDLMLKRFDRMYTKEYQKAVKDSGHTLDEIITLASMVEKEIKLPEERATAAGVMYNRLKKNMSLGIDATVLYAVGKTSGELTQSDLDIDSPYNTRKNKGLPLGPISNPGEASIKAALYPEEHDYLYYVVEAVGKDNHVYCKTYDEFLTAKDAYNASAQ